MREQFQEITSNQYVNSTLKEYKTSTHAVAVPPELAALPMRTFKAQAASIAYAHPRSQLARLVRKGALHRLAHGFYSVTPQEHLRSSWAPETEAAAAGVGTAVFGQGNAVLMGVSAARAYGAIPRAIADAVIASPTQHAPVRFVDRDGQIYFVKRNIETLDIQPVNTELGRAMITTPEQTCIDLAHTTILKIGKPDTIAAIQALWPNCDQVKMARLSKAQRKKAALERARTWVR